ncbi:MAG: hypothetical protein K2I08_01200 [Muribaculaceae bacterium]|nr:hypothetical protein [Muribaculaceae bacterium]MDE6522094.1 hypothetical protein [Muribaculaceae bacterium]
MNSNNMDIDQMRKAWIEMGKALGMETLPDEPDNMNKKKTSLDRLCTRYMRGRDFTILATIIFPIFFFWMPSLGDEYKIPVAITYVIVMSANAYLLNWFQRGLGRIDPLTMPITQVSSMAKYYKKCHIRYLLFGYLVAIPWSIYFIYALSCSGFRSIDDLVFGAIIGGICGLYGVWKDMKDYRNLVE